MAKGEGEVIGKSIARPVPFIENGPGLISPMAPADKLFGDTNRPPHWSGNGEGVHERRAPSQPAAGRNRVILEDRYRDRFKAHLSKTGYSGRKSSFFKVGRRNSI